MIKLIPAPMSFEVYEGTLLITDDLKVKTDFPLPLLKLQRAEDAMLVIEKDDNLKPEEYSLEVTQSGIKISAADEAGAYYALQSLRQISGYELGERSIICCKICDKPRFNAHVP